MRRITNTVFRLLRGEKGSSEIAKKVEPFWGTASKRKGAIALDQALLELNKVGTAVSDGGGGGRKIDCEISLDGDASSDKLYLAGVAEFERGGGIPNSKAVAYWREASKKGHINATYSLASCLIKEDITTARDLLEDLAEKGHGPAMYTLALMLSPDVRKVEGGVEPDRQMEDDTKALKLYESAARLGVAPAMKNLANMLAAGRGGPVDEAKAAKWYEIGAETGDPSSAFIYGNWLCTGRGGLQKDAHAGFRYQMKAAETGVRLAQYNVGCLLFEGEGVEQDVPQAAQWWRKSAENGARQAMLNLAKLHAYGIGGVNKSKEEAMKWLRMAVGPLDKEMSEEDVNVELQRLLREVMEQPFQLKGEQQEEDTLPGRSVNKDEQKMKH